MALKLLKSVIEVLDVALTFKKNHLLRKSEHAKYAAAIAAISKATIQTRNFIKKHGYVANTTLSDLWIDAMEKVIQAKIYDDLPKHLIDKARFWGDPQNWLANPNSMVLVPKLMQLEEKCEMLLMEINR